VTSGVGQEDDAGPCCQSELGLGLGHLDTLRAVSTFVSTVPYTGQRSRTQQGARFLLCLPFPAPTPPGIFKTRWHTARFTFLGQLIELRRAGPRVRLRSPPFSTFASPFLSRDFKKVLLFVLSQRQTSEHDQRFSFTPQRPAHVPPFLSRLLARHPRIQSHHRTPVLLLR
jgi:hypothetical protein